MCECLWKDKQNDSMWRVSWWNDYRRVEVNSSCEGFSSSDDRKLFYWSVGFIHINTYRFSATNQILSNKLFMKSTNILIPREIFVFVTFCTNIKDSDSDGLFCCLVSPVVNAIYCQHLDSQVNMELHKNRERWKLIKNNPRHSWMKNDSMEPKSVFVFFRKKNDKHKKKWDRKFRNRIQR